MERFDGRRVTRYNVNQYLSRAVSVQKTLSTILASTKELIFAAVTHCVSQHPGQDKFFYGMRQK